MIVGEIFRLQPITNRRHGAFAGTSEFKTDLAGVSLPALGMIKCELHGQLTMAESGYGVIDTVNNHLQ